MLPSTCSSFGKENDEKVDWLSVVYYLCERFKARRKHKFLSMDDVTKNGDT